MFELQKQSIIFRRKSETTVLRFGDSLSLNIKPSEISAEMTHQLGHRSQYVLLYLVAAHFGNKHVTSRAWSVMKSLMMTSAKPNGKYKAVINFVLLSGILLTKKKNKLIETKQTSPCSIRIYNNQQCS